MNFDDSLEYFDQRNLELTTMPKARSRQGTVGARRKMVKKSRLEKKRAKQVSKLNRLFDELAPGQQFDLPIQMRAALVGSNEIKFLIRYEVAGDAEKGIPAPSRHS